LVEKQEDLMTIPLSCEDRTGYLPQLLSDVIAGLHLDSCTKAPISFTAGHHGDLRHKPGYSAAMVVEEPRLSASLPVRHSAQAHQATGLRETAAGRANHP
jgi:hypothetical protein